jgi:hypothetical protein
MRSLSGVRLRLIVLIAIVGGLAMVGIVYASIPDSNGVIHGCYANKGGGLRVIDTGTGQSCHANKETMLSWNQSGPTGATGLPGPSDAYTVEGSRVIPGDGTNYTVASMSLPQGSFVVSAVVRLAANLGTGTSVTCLTLQDGGPILDGASDANLNPPQVVTVPILGRAVISNQTSTLTLACRSDARSTICRSARRGVVLVLRSSA